MLNIMISWLISAEVFSLFPLSRQFAQFTQLLIQSIKELKCFIYSHILVSQQTFIIFIFHYFEYLLRLLSEYRLSIVSILL